MPFQQNPLACPVCSRSAAFAFLKDWKGSEGNFSLYECSLCGVQFWLPFESKGGAWYEAKTKYQIGSARRQGIVREYHKEFIRLHPHFSRRKILDVGCGTGEFLGELQKRGADVWGIDFDKNAIASTQRFFGVKNAYAISLEDFVLQYPQEKFDFVTCFETIQYSQAPLEFFKTMRQLLAKDGILVLSIVSSNRFFPNMVKWDFPPNHMSRWNEKAVFAVGALAELHVVLLNYLEKFRLLRETMSSPFQYGFVGKALAGPNPSPLKAGLLQLLGIIKSYITGAIPALFLYMLGFITNKKYGTIYAEFHVS